MTTSDMAINTTHITRSSRCVFFSLFRLICFATKSTENDELADSTSADSVDMLALSSRVKMTAIKISGTMEASVSMVVMMFTEGSAARSANTTRPMAPQKYAPQPMMTAKAVEIYVAFLMALLSLMA